MVNAQFINEVANGVALNRMARELRIEQDVDDVINVLHPAEEAIVAHMEVIAAGYDEPTQYEIACDLEPVMSSGVKPLPVGSNQEAEPAIDLSAILPDSYAEDVESMLDALDTLDILREVVKADPFCEIVLKGGDVEIAAHYMNGQQAGRAKADWELGMVACEDSGNRVIVENGTGSRNTVVCTYKYGPKCQFDVLDDKGESHPRLLQIRKSAKRDDLYTKPLFVALAYKGRSIQLVGTDEEIASFAEGLDAGYTKEVKWLNENFFSAPPIQS